MATQHETQTQALPAPGDVIPIPEDFPVVWRNHDDVGLAWELDRMHFPAALTPMTESLFADILLPNFNRAAEALHLPVRLLPQVFNGYLYEAAVPPFDSADEMRAEGERGEALAESLMGRLRERWLNELLPEVEEHLQTWDSFDLGVASLEALRVHLDETIARGCRMWELHFLVVLPLPLPVHLFEEMHCDLFGAEAKFEAYRMLQGLNNLTLDMGRHLWRLSRRALTIPQVRSILEELPADSVMPALEQSDDGQAFLAEFRAYLERWGKRGPQLIELAHPSWIEDPSPAIIMLKEYVAQPDRDLQAEVDEQIVQRNKTTQEVRDRLRHYPQAVRDHFEFQLRAAQDATMLSEDHTYYLDFGTTHRIRMVLLECGKRLAANGNIAHRDDVFYLTIDETQHALLEGAGTDLHRLVRERKDDMERYRQLTPPLSIGTMPSDAPPPLALVAARNKFSGDHQPHRNDSSSVRGVAGSPGVARGPARIVQTLGDASRLHPGDILVVQTTSPPWTPLFAVAGAVVTDTGGILSHCAVIAREYGIPAVVGTGNGSIALEDGQLIEVNGWNGTVTRVEIQ